MLRRRQGDGERRALAVGAGDSQVAAHQPAEVAADRQPESGPTVLAPGGGLGLGERLEEPPELLLRHPDPGVGDREGYRGQGTGDRGVGLRPRTLSPKTCPLVTRSVMVPWSVNLAALERRLKRV